MASAMEEGGAGGDGDLKLESSTDKGFIENFLSLPVKPDTLIRLFDRGGEYYTLHGSDAVFVAKEILKSTAAVKQFGGERYKLPSLGLSKNMFERVIRELLLIRQYRVEIWQCSTGNHWSPAYTASPGNLHALEDVLFTQFDITQGCGILCLKVSSSTSDRAVTVAACFCDAMLREIGVTSFLDHPVHLTNTEALIVQLKPKEALLLNRPDQESLKKKLESRGVMVSYMQAKNMNPEDGEQTLRRLLSDEVSVSTGVSLGSDVLSCVTGVAGYLELMSRSDDLGKYRLIIIDSAQHLQLDEAAIRALSLEAEPGGVNLGRAGSLISLLDQCRTPQGKRLLRLWIRQPLTDRRRLEERLNLVEALYQDVALRDSLLNLHLRHFPDFYKLTRKLQRGKGNLQDSFKLYMGVRAVPDLLKTIETYEGTHSDLLKASLSDPLLQLSTQLQKLLELVETTLDLDRVNQHEYVIQSSFDEGLGELRIDMDECKEKIDGHVLKVKSRVRQDCGKSIKLDQSSLLGHYMRVTMKESTPITDDPNFIVLEARKEGVRFTTSYLQELSAHYFSLQEQYTTLQVTLVEEVLRIVCGYQDPLIVLNDLIAQLDVLTSFAVASVTAPIPYCKPKLLEKEEKIIILEGARHPCLELQSGVSFIPNDVIFRPDQQMFILITGPNMGGKSTYIRQIGVVVLLAQIGCFVPCSQATISIVDRILARVGASDSQLRGISTFMSEMLETSAILHCSSPYSLILIDELGRGTSTYDGFGIAWSISDHIARNINAYCLFATHFHELTYLASEISSVVNYHVTALTSQDTFTLLYKVKPGPCDQSFGIHVAELANFPKEVIEKAKTKALSLEDSTITIPIQDNTELSKRIKLDKEEGEELIDRIIQQASEIQDRRGSLDYRTSLLSQLNKSDNLVHLMFEYESNDYMTAINDCSYNLSSEYQFQPESPGYSKFPDLDNEQVYPLVDYDLNFGRLITINVHEYSSVISVFLISPNLLKLEKL
ncbi:hypothetical protein LOD99_7696 [Oopsacas minuta]|uniref:DNA mismatch repair protein Msh2 n=1 Tax=Oopsacas minuta TaxID=111878 RepID=A0AAV7JPB1_9METZ|nr:hypothetical protein LOD99_7696 [Oopsacas minuta]